MSFYGPTAKAVRAKLHAARGRLDAGAPVRDATRSVADWLSHWRATTLAASDRKESTRALYANLARKHLEPAPFGAIPLDRLRPSDVEALVLALPRPRGLSDSTVRQIYTVLRAGLDGAVRDGLIAPQSGGPGEPSGRRAPRGQAPGRRCGCGGAEGPPRASRYHPALVLIAATGLRRG